MTKPRKRSRSSAREAGRAFERDVMLWLRDRFDDRDIDRQVKKGTKDEGDIRGVKHMGQRDAIECKNVARLNLSGWVSEAEIARGNTDAGAGLVIHKRHGVSDPAQQYVTMTLGDLAALMTGEAKDLT